MMKIVLSPAKTFRSEPLAEECLKTLRVAAMGSPVFLREANSLVRLLKKKRVEDLRVLMKVSTELSEVTYNRFKKWDSLGKKGNVMPAAYAFQGDVYRGLAVESYSAAEVKRLNEQVFILSGLYGLLRPLDGIQPYRLVMGTSLENNRGKNLYMYWGDRVAKALRGELTPGEVLINLASHEYFKVIKPYLQDIQVTTVVFKENVKGSAKIVGFKAKYARGLMTRFIIKHKLSDRGDLVDFQEEGYRYDKKASDARTLIFTH